MAGIDRTIKILHVLGYADPNDGRKPMPVQPGEAGTMGQPHQYPYGLPYRDTQGIGSDRSMKGSAPNVGIDRVNPRRLNLYQNLILPFKLGRAEDYRGQHLWPTKLGNAKSLHSGSSNPV